MEIQENHPEKYEMNRGVDAQSDEQYGGEISLKPLARVLWLYRRVLILSVSLVLILFIVGALFFYLSQPVEHQASIEFKLLFEGADHDKYPNGLAFSRAEIIGTPVLTKVYEIDDLKRYTTYDNFKNGILIGESSRELELLRLEYQAKLSDTRLTPVDRARLEQEFRQKQEALHVPQYTLSFMSGGAVGLIPDSVMNKVLNDILATWAEQAVDRKGVLNYQVRVFTPNVLLKDFLLAEDYLVRLDIIREKINAVIDNIDELLKLPGANLTRVGEAAISLPEVRANLEDIRRFKLEPLIGVAESKGISKDANQLIRYVERRLGEADLDRQEAAARVAYLQEALRSYLLQRGSVVTPGREGTSNASGLGSTIPQLSESFLDRLVAMSNQNADLEYRQKLTDDIIRAGQSAVVKEKEAMYYRDLAASIKRAIPAHTNEDRAAIASIEDRLNEIYSSVVTGLAQINEVYKEVSRQNLNPRTNLYTVTSPFGTTRHAALTLSTISVYGALALLMSAILAPLLCIVHYYFRQEILPREQPRRVESGHAGEETPSSRAASQT